MKTLKNLVNTETLHVDELMMIKGAVAEEAKPTCDSYKCSSGGCSGTSCNQNSCNNCACKTNACGNGTCKNNGCSNSINCSVTGDVVYY